MKQFLKNMLLQAWYTLFNKEYRLLKRSHLFDPVNYLKNNPDVSASGMDPIRHYISKGYKDGRTVSILFDHHYYLDQLSDEDSQDINPLVHYLSGGWKDGIKPNRSFDPCLYADEHPEIDFSKIDPLSYFLQQEENGSHPPYFDVSWYLDNTPVLTEKNIDPLRHYMEFGIAEGKSPIPLFDPAYYKETYGLSDGKDIFAHYILYGVRMNRKPCSWFDSIYYREKYLSDEASEGFPLAHFISNGLKMGYYPNRDVAELEHKPLISLLVPVYNVSSAFLRNCIRSVLYQSYPHWELCLVDDCSTDEKVREILIKWEKYDKRIKVNFLEKNEGIAGATNAAASLASGDYIGFLDNDDELTADCLFNVVSKINSEKGDLYYSDEVLIGDDGTKFTEFRKPDYNESLLLSHNYVTHFVVAEAALYQVTGGLDPEMSGAQDFDLFLKLSEDAEKIVHIPEILYRWRAHESSTSVNHAQKSYADDAGRRALEAAMARRKIPAIIENTEWKFFYHVNRELLVCPKVSVIIRHQENAGFKEWLHLLSEKTAYLNVEFLVIMQEGKDKSKETVGSGFPGHISFFQVPGSQLLFSMYNQVAKVAKGEYLVFLTPKVEVLNQNWIEEMLKQSMLSNTAFVTGRILPPSENECISREPDLEDNSPLYYNRFLQECSRHMNGLECEQNVFMLSCDFSMVKRARFLECGGFASNEFPLLFADSDLCLRLRQKGYENIYTPYASAKWLESGDDVELNVQQDMELEKNLFQRRWHKELSTGDLYYNCAVVDSNIEKQDAFRKWYAGENDN